MTSAAIEEAPDQATQIASPLYKQLSTTEPKQQANVAKAVFRGY